MNFPGGCVNGSRIPRRGCRQARGRTVGPGRTSPPGTPSTTAGYSRRSSGPASCPCYRAGRGPAPRPGGRAPATLVMRRGLARISLTYYVSDLTTEEARALAQALDDAGLNQGRSRICWLTTSRSQARASIHLLPRRGKSETRCSLGFCLTSPTARRSAWGEGERESGLLARRNDLPRAVEVSRTSLHSREVRASIGSKRTEWRTTATRDTTGRRPNLTFGGRDGSDGTRTRDLRRDSSAAGVAVDGHWSPFLALCRRSGSTPSQLVAVGCHCCVP